MMGSIILNCRIQTLWILDSSWTLILSKFSGLIMVSESSWILVLDSWILVVALSHCGLQASPNYSVFLLPLTGVVGFHQRLRLVTPTHRSFEPKIRTVMHPCVLAILTTPKSMENQHE